MQTLVLAVAFVAGLFYYGDCIKLDCTNVKCASPDSLDCNVLIKNHPNYCCGFCPKKDKKGEHCKDGKTAKPIKHGESRKVDCNTCYCNDGKLLCTKIACNPCDGREDGVVVSTDPCVECTCHSEKPQCVAYACLTCDVNILPPEGECCPQCPCQEGGTTYEHDAIMSTDADCGECRCYYGTKTCENSVQCVKCREPGEIGCCPPCP